MPNWTDELIRVATILNEFDGESLTTGLFPRRFELISNRDAEARDASDFRDEYGSYLSYLGLMGYENTGDGWICHIDPLAKDLLCSDIPDPNAYMRLKMSLFQYPNPIGIHFYPNGRLRVEALSLEKRHKQISNEVKIVPFRAILKCLLALFEKQKSEEVYLSYSEIWAYIFQNSTVNTNLNFNAEEIIKRIIDSRQTGLLIPYPDTSLRNLHIIAHTGLVYKVSKPENRIYLTQEITKNQNSDVFEMAKLISEMKEFFEITKNSNFEDIKHWTSSVYLNGSWFNYFSGNAVKNAEMSSIKHSLTSIETISPIEEADISAPLSNFVQNQAKKSKNTPTRLANPEETQILREKANLQHRVIVRMIADRLIANDIHPLSNTFIDLCCNNPNPLLFEIKSCNQQNQLSQTRKAISQLYEYRYRHQELHGAKLILAFEQKPTDNLEWLIDYLVTDREITPCWIDGEQQIVTLKQCVNGLESIIDYTI